MKKNLRHLELDLLKQYPRNLNIIKLFYELQSFKIRMSCFIICLISISTFGQYIRVSPEFSNSSIRGNSVDVLENNVQTFAIKLGIDYAEHDNYFVSSNLGYKQRGGNEKNPLLMGDWNKITKRWNYISLDSYINYKLNISNAYFYVGVGPEINFLLSKNPFENTPYENSYELNKILFSANSQLGFTRVFGNFRFSAYSYYTWNLSKIGKSDFNNLTNNGFNFGVSFGYDLDKL